MGKAIIQRPWKITAKAGGEIEILLYEMIGQDWWTGDGTTAKAFAEDLKGAGDVKKVHLRVNSPGGDVFDGIAIYNTLLSCGAIVTAQVDGLAASIASVIIMAASEISMGDNAMMMIHNPWTAVQGDSNDMRKMAETMDKVKTSMVTAYQRHCKMSADEIGALMDTETWMTAQEAKDKGFAEVVTTPEGNEADVAANVDLSRFRKVPQQVAARVAAAKKVCGCACAECGDKKNCSGCTGTDCKDPNCKDCPQQKNAAATVPPAQHRENPPANAESKGKQVMETKETSAAAAVVVNDAGDERKRACELTELGKQYGVDVSAFLADGTSVNDAKMAIADIAIARAKENAKTSGLAQPTVVNMTEKERGDYSITRAILSMCGDGEAGLEAEVSKSIAKALGRTTSGMFIPTRLKAAGLDTKSNAAGNYTVATEVRDMIELLRNKCRVIKMGATVLSGLQGNQQFPKQSSASAGSWVAQNPGSDVSDSDAAFGVLSLSPKTYQASTSFSRQFLAQSTIDAESFVRNDLAFAHALAIDLAAINGSGSSNQPLGLLKTSGIGSVAIGTNGGAPTYGSIVDLETAIADANADEAGMAFLSTPIMRGKLKKVGLLDSTYASIPLWQQVANAPGVGDLIGYPAYVSKQCPAGLTKGTSSDCHAIIFGYWPSLLIGEWGVIEVLADPYRLKKQGMIEVTSFQMVDVGLRQPAQFAACVDARNV